MVPFERRPLNQSAIVIIALSCIISEIKRDIAENRDFLILTAFDSPVSGAPSEYCHLRQKN